MQKALKPKMIHNKKAIRSRDIVIVLIFSVALAIIGFSTAAEFYEWMLPKVDTVKFDFPSMEGMIRHPLYYAGTLALIPIATALAWHFWPVSPGIKRLMSAGLIIAFTFLGAILRMKWIMYLATGGLEKETALHMSISVPFDKLMLPLFMCYGLLSGILVSFFIFRDRRKTAVPQGILHD